MSSVSNNKPAKVGKFWGVPYDWRRPTWARFRLRLWNPDEPRIIRPRVYGWGFTINFYRLFHSKKK